MRLKELNSWITSIGLHVILLVALVFTWKTKIITNPDPSISVDIIADTAEDIGNSQEIANQQNQLSQEKQQDTPQSQTAQAAPPPPPDLNLDTAPTPAPPPPPPPPQEAKPTALESLKAILQKPKPAPIPAPQPQTKPNPQPAPQTKKAAPNPALPKPAPSSPAPKNNADNIGFQFDVPAATKASSGVNSGAKSAPRLTASGQSSKGKGQGSGQRLQSSLENILREQIKRCWPEPADLSDPQSLLVELQIELTENGQLARPPKLAYPNTKSGASPSLMVAIDNAFRATKQCAPYNLPPERFEEWRNFKFRFDPQKLRH